MDPITDILDSLSPEALSLEAGTRSYDGRRFAESVYRTGNFLRHCGVHEGSTVEIIPVESPETIFGILGAICLGGRVSFEPGRSQRPAVRLGPTRALSGTDIPGGCKPVGYDTPPEDPSWAYFERAVWSENPTFPETDLDPDRAVFAEKSSDGLNALLQEARAVADSLSSSDRVAVRTKISNAGPVTTGVFAPLLAGATILLPDENQTGTVAVSRGDAPEPRILRPD